MFVGQFFTDFAPIRYGSYSVCCYFTGIWKNCKHLWLVDSCEQLAVLSSLEVIEQEYLS